MQRADPIALAEYLARNAVRMRQRNNLPEHKLESIKDGAARRSTPIYFEQADEDHFLELLRIGTCTYCAYEPAITQGELPLMMT